MRIAFISPKSIGMGTDEENKRSYERWQKLKSINAISEQKSCPNLALITIASIVGNYFDEMVYIDEEIEDIPPDKDFDIVAMSFMTPQATRAYELCGIFREKGVYLVAGGIHATVCQEEALNYFDTVFVGEGENTWPEFVRDYEEHNPKKLYVNTSEVDMTSIPVPRFDLLNINKYKTIPIQISRGCPHNCEFCTATRVYGSKYRHKNVEQVLAEIEAVKKHKKMPYIYFADDNVQFKRPFIAKLLEEFKSGGFSWTAFTDISVANYEDVLENLILAGCRRLSIGFESIVPESLRSLEEWKYKRLDTYGEAIQKIQSYGIGLYGFFIVGLDGDDISVFQRVVDFILENNLYGALISIPTPFPGSRLQMRMHKEGRILSTHWGSYDFYNVVFQPAKMTVKELQDGFEYVLAQIYSKEAVQQRYDHFKKIFVSLQRRKA